MSRNLNLVIFGASGFTGKYAVVEIIKLAEEFKVTWGVAGRDKNKLIETLDWAAKKTNNATVRDIPIIIADIKEELTLNEMAEQTNVLVNCCGPYRHFGEPVVKACVESGTHYVDVSGENYFMENMQWKYDHRARQKGVYVVSSCGVDSIPADLGVVHLRKIFNGTMSVVETYLSAKEKVPGGKNEALIHYGTWSSLVHGLGNSKELGPLRRKLFSEKLPKFSPELPHRGNIFKYEGKWYVPFPGSDRMVVHRTQRHSYFTKNERPIHMEPYFEVDGLFQAFSIGWRGMLIFALSKSQSGRDLLLKHPKFFTNGAVSHEGPSEEYMNNCEFTMKFFAQGWAPKDRSETYKAIKAVLSGTNPGYGFTVTALLLSAITILKEKHLLPENGGVYTPGSAFENTTLFDNLLKHGMKFEIIKVVDDRSKL